MTSQSSMPRRAVFGATAAAGSLALAACAPSSQSNAPASAPAPAGGGTPVRVGKLSDVKVGGTAQGTANGQSIVIYRPDNKTVVAYSATCPHAGCAVAPASQEFDCPCHGSTFRAADGSVISGPARQPLTKLTAAIDGEWITVKA